MSRRPRNHGHTGGNPPADQGLLTVRQVAENWQMSQRMIRCMIADGRLPVIRLGRSVRILDRSVWALGEHRPADRDRELRKQPNE